VTAGSREPGWLAALNGNPLPWLLAKEAPAVRHRALRELLGHDADGVEVVRARRAAMASDPIAAILAAQDPQGWWVKPGGGYGPKYTGTVWSLIFLDQMGADGGDPRIRTACSHVLEHAQAPSGGFGFSSGSRPPTPSTVVHCLNGNLLRALIGFGLLDDERVQRSIDWQAAAATGEGDISWYRSATSGPGFGCGINEQMPCGWGAAKAVLALARIPANRRSARVTAALNAGVEFLLSVDPATARYPMGWGNTRPNASWFRLGFPSGYVADVLQVLEAVCEAGHAADVRLRPALTWLLAQQDATGRWKNQNRYHRKMHAEVDAGRGPSRWVTLRACRVLQMVDAASPVGGAASP